MASANVPASDDVLGRAAGRRRGAAGALRAAWRLARRSPLTVFAVAVLAALAVAAVGAPRMAPYDPLEMHRADRLQAPNRTYLLGTDGYGRDQLSRLMHGARVSLLVGIVPVLVSATAGTVLGLLSAYFGAWVDVAIQRVMDGLMAFPALVLALTIAALLGGSLPNVILAIAVVTTPNVNRVVRGAALSVMAQPYVESARALGAPHWRILARHVLPNVLAPILIVGTSLVGAAILAEAALSFLGLGLAPPSPTWGNMLSGASRGTFEVAPWLAIFPGLAITVTVLAFNLLGDALRDLLDPRLRGSRPAGS